jgi:succinate dehydrogenase/fumarate reductase flavoprotein subunit
MFPLQKNLFRTEHGLRGAIGNLDGLWQSVGGRAIATESARDVQRAREAAALVATARWAYASALERRETRGMHRRADHPQIDPAQHHYQHSGGLDRVWVRAG